MTLEVGGLSETVQVAADAGLLTMTTSTTARSLTGAELETIPTSTGSFTHLLSSEAGVSADLPPVLINGTGNISPSVNGTRTTSTSLFFNGIDATNLTTNEGSMSDNIAPASDTLEEVKLQTSMYDASTGRSGGGNFQLVTRSGTNAFKGSAHFNFQHEKMNSNDFFYEKDGIDKPKARRNEGGFTHRRSDPPEPVLLLRRLPADAGGNRVRADGEQHHGAAAGAPVDSGRAHEGERPRGVCGVEPGDSAVDSEGAVFRARPTRPASRTSR